MIKRANSTSNGNLRFSSITTLERSLDGTDERFAEYYFAIYHCSPDEPAEINDLRKQLRREYPTNAIPVGNYFVLDGEPAYLALVAYHQAMIDSTTLSEEFREYMSECLERITVRHRRSQSLSINLLEGQLSHDPRLEFLTCIAIGNGQILQTDIP
ncbi:hypothetical protein [Janthinobacterium sp. BJB426]|uniref:hypothetical protein n=1 Tax=Janthinobacterium sp. BJB426 TaxID=2048010 RepID=UPI00130528D3|nr:hypothetical protein [Janthinobacterium sp. BJB426]